MGPGMDNGDLPSRLAFVLRYTGVSQAEFARRAGVSALYLSETSRGLHPERKPRLRNLARVADAAGVPYGWLAFGDGPPPEGQRIRDYVRSQPPPAATGTDR